MIEKIANRPDNMLEFPYFVLEEEREYNVERAKGIKKGDWTHVKMRILSET